MSVQQENKLGRSIACSISISYSWKRHKTSNFKTKSLTQKDSVRKKLRCINDYNIKWAQWKCASLRRLTGWVWNPGFQKLLLKSLERKSESWQSQPSPPTNWKATSQNHLTKRLLFKISKTKSAFPQRQPFKVSNTKGTFGQSHPFQAMFMLVKNFNQSGLIFKFF